MIRLLTFDLDNTLWEPNRCGRRRTRRLIGLGNAMHAQAVLPRRLDSEARKALRHEVLGRRIRYLRHRVTRFQVGRSWRLGF